METLRGRGGDIEEGGVEILRRRGGDIEGAGWRH